MPTIAIAYHNFVVSREVYAPIIERPPPRRALPFLCSSAFFIRVANGLARLLQFAVRG